MILKYYTPEANVGILEITAKDIQKFLDDFFEASQRHYKHDDRQPGENMQPADIAVHNSLTEGFWKFNGPLSALASIHLNRKEVEKPKAKKDGK